MERPEAGDTSPRAKRKENQNLDTQGIPAHPKKGLRIGADLAFFDESGFSDRPNVRKTWAKRGKTPVIRTAGGWKNISVAAAIVTDPKLEHPPAFYAMVQRRSVKSPDIIRYLKNLKRQHRRKKLILLWDGLPAHRSKETKTFLTKERSWLTVERFPAYAPELNPSEYGWANIKVKESANGCFPTVESLEQKVKNGIRRLKRSPTLLQGFLRASGLFKC